MEIRNLKQSDNINIIDLWNKHYGSIYPITIDMFKRNSSNFHKDASFVVYENNILIAFIISKEWNDDYLIPTYDESCWINLFLVDASYRNKGIGTTLLNKVEEYFKGRKKILFLGKDYNNYFPGLPVDLKSSLYFFKNRGFTTSYDTYDLIKSKNNFKMLDLRSDSFVFRQAKISDKENLLSFLHNNWPGRWEKEAIDYFKNGGDGSEYIICLDNDFICAFAKVCFKDTQTSLMSYSHTWKNKFDSLGGIGPLGVDKNYRKKNLGYDIVAFSSNLLLKDKTTEVIIDWTGLLDFYRKLGFEVYKSYSYMKKDL